MAHIHWDGFDYNSGSGVSKTGTDQPAYSRYSARTHEWRERKAISIAFAEVFAEEPWNEWKKCGVCKAQWGLKDADSLAELGYLHCNEPIIEFWPSDSVQHDLHHEVTAHASCWLAYQDNRVVGFTWGYPINPTDLEQKLGIPIVDVVERAFGKVDAVAYQDELGVLEGYRGRSIAKKLFMLRHGDFVARGLRVGVVRTRRSPEPSVTYLWFTEKLGYCTLAEYDDGRVVLGKDITHLDQLF